MNTKNTVLVLVATIALALAVPSAQAVNAYASAHAGCRHELNFDNPDPAGWYAWAHGSATASAGVLDVGAVMTAEAEANGISDADAASWPLDYSAEADADYPPELVGIGYMSRASASAFVSAMTGASDADAAEEMKECKSDEDGVEEVFETPLLNDLGEEIPRVELEFLAALIKTYADRVNLRDMDVDDDAVDRVDLRDMEFDDGAVGRMGLSEDPCDRRLRLGGDTLPQTEVGLLQYRAGCKLMLTEQLLEPPQLMLNPKVLESRWSL